MQRCQKQRFWLLWHLQHEFKQKNTKILIIFHVFFYLLICMYVCCWSKYWSSKAWKIIKCQMFNCIIMLWFDKNKSTQHKNLSKSMSLLKYIRFFFFFFKLQKKKCFSLFKDIFTSFFALNNKPENQFLKKVKTWWSKLFIETRFQVLEKKNDRNFIVRKWKNWKQFTLYSKIS